MLTEKQVRLIVRQEIARADRREKFYKLTTEQRARLFELARADLKPGVTVFLAQPTGDSDVRITVRDDPERIALTVPVMSLAEWYEAGYIFADQLTPPMSFILTERAFAYQAIAEMQARRAGILARILLKQA